MLLVLENVNLVYWHYAGGSRNIFELTASTEDDVEPQYG